MKIQPPPLKATLLGGRPLQRFSVQSTSHLPLPHSFPLNETSWSSSETTTHKILLPSSLPNVLLPDRTFASTFCHHLTKDRPFFRYWLSVGAQPSDPVQRILFRAGLLPPPPMVAMGRKGGPRDTRPVDPLTGCVLTPANPSNSKDSDIPNIEDAEIVDTAITS